MAKPRHELEELLRISERRRHALERQTIMFGIHTPPYVHLELEDVRAQIERLQAELIQLPASPDQQASFSNSSTPDLYPNAKAPPARASLPEPTTSLIGRERETEAVCALLRQPQTRLVSLIGPGGTGKTRLALRVAQLLAGDYPDGVWFVGLGSAGDTTLATATIAQALAVQEVAGLPLDATLKAFLQEKRTLLVLDNFEQLLDTAPLVASLLAAAVQLNVLVTSRAVLRISGEHEYAVPPLGLPNLQKRPPLAQLAESESIKLFVERVQLVRPNFILTEENAAAVAEICARLDGLPLAIELAAARCKTFLPQALLARLKDRLGLLTGGARDRPERQQTLRNAIDWSYRLLDPGEQTLFARLSVFAGGCRPDAAVAVCNADGSLAADVLDCLVSLADKSLLYQRDDPDGEPRFFMLETIRDYARLKLDETGDATTTAGRHLGFFLNYARAIGNPNPKPKPGMWWELPERELDNFRTALSWSTTSTDRHEDLQQLALALIRFWRARGYLSEGRQWLQLAFEHSTDAPPDMRARLLHQVGLMIQSQGKYAESRAYLEQSLALYRTLDRKQNIAALLRAAAWAAYFVGERQLAQAHFDESLALCREIGYQRGIADSLDGIGRLAWNRRDFETARPLLEESLALRRALGDETFIPGAIAELGDLAHAQRDYGTARALLEESLAIRRALGHKGGLAGVLGRLGRVAHAEGEWDQAHALFQEGLTLYREIDDKRGIAWILSNMSPFEQEQGNLSAAWDLRQESVECFRLIGEHNGVTNGLNILGNIAWQRGDYLQARALFNKSIEVARTNGLRRHVARALRGLAIVAQLESRDEEALSLSEESMVETRALDDPLEMIDTLVDRGYLAYQQADYQQAETCYDTCLTAYQDKISWSKHAWILYLKGQAERRGGNLERAHALLCDSLDLLQMHKRWFRTWSCLIYLAGIATERGEHERATRLAGAIEASAGAHGFQWYAEERATYEADLAHTRAHLNEEHFNAAWSAGRALSLEQAIEEAKLFI